MGPEPDQIAVVVGVDVGKENHYAVALDHTLGGALATCSVADPRHCHWKHARE